MRTHRARLLPLLLAGLLSPAAPGAQPRPAPATDAGPSPAEAARRAQAVARVGDQAITVGEFEDMLNEAPGPVRQRYLNPTERRAYLEHLVTTYLLAAEARRQGLDRNPEVSASVRRILSQRLEQRAVLEAVTPESVPQSEVAAYYQAHLADYQQPEFRRATVIITADRETAARVVTDVRAARGDLRRVRELVRQHSVDEPSKAHEGDVFYFQRSGAPTGDGQALDAALASAVFGLAREMDVTPQPVALANNRFGVAVLTGTRPALRREVTDPGVVATIRGFLVRDRRAQRTAALLQQARDRLHPEVHEDRLGLINLPPGELGNLPPFDPHSTAHPNTH
jgi:peptidyl-prolyl cis-trans isomerase C